MSVEHDTWSVTRDYPRPVAAVFRAWSDAAVKVRWFDLSPAGGEYRHDFRVGGAESYRTPPGVSPEYGYDAVYHDLVPDSRIVTAYTVTADRRRVSVSLSTVELSPINGGTRLVLTEQGAYLDGRDTPASRRSGTVTQLEALGRVLAHEKPEHDEAGHQKVSGHRDADDTGGPSWRSS